MTDQADQIVDAEMKRVSDAQVNRLNFPIEKGK